jgi:single-strand DNA-binding protein
MAIGRRQRSADAEEGMRVFVAGKLVQRSWQDNDGNKRQSVEIQVTHVGPDLQFATAEVAKATTNDPPRLRRQPGNPSSTRHSSGAGLRRVNSSWAGRGRDMGFGDQRIMSPVHYR